MYLSNSSVHIFGLPIYVYFCRIHLSINLFLSLSLSLSLTVSLSISLSMYLSIYLSIGLLVYLLVYGSSLFIHYFLNIIIISLNLYLSKYLKFIWKSTYLPLDLYDDASIFLPKVSEIYLLRINLPIRLRLSTI